MSTSQQAAKPTESPFDTYLRGLDTSRCTPREFGDDMDLHARNIRYAPCGIGMPGVGKSATVYQRAALRGAPFATADTPNGPSLVLHTPQLGVDDLFLPSIPVTEIPATLPEGIQTLFYQRRVPLTWRPILEYVAKNWQAIDAGEKLPPIVLIEEVNRPREKAVTSALFTLIEDRRVGDLLLPRQIQIVLLMNPAVGGMQVHPFEKDSAARRRVGFMGITPSMSEWLQFAHGAKLHQSVVDFISAHPSYFYDEKALLAGKLFACPASWETVAVMAKRCDDAGLGMDSASFIRTATGKVGIGAAAALVEFARTRSVHVIPADVLEKYKEHSEVRTRVLEMMRTNRNDVVADLAIGVSSVVFAPAPGDRRAARSLAPMLALFMDDVPADVATQLFNRLNTEAATAAKGQEYLRELSSALSQVPAYQRVQTKIAEARKRVVAERIDSEKDGTPDPNAN